MDYYVCKNGKFAYFGYGLVDNIFLLIGASAVIHYHFNVTLFTVLALLYVFRDAAGLCGACMYASDIHGAE